MGRKIKQKDTVEEIFSSRLNDLILDWKEKGISLSRIAEATEISKAALSQWRNSDKIKGIPKVDYLRKLASYFGVTVEWLAGTPGAVRTPDETLAATGLSAAALSNLIEINKMCQAASHVSEDILSTILASENFTALIRAMIDLTFLADDLEEQVTIARAMQGKAEEPAVNLDYLENSIKALRFGRYSVVEPCNAILDELRPATIEDVLKDLNNYRNEK